MPNVLLIDHCTCGSRLLAHALQRGGYEVHIAPDAEEAFSLLRLYPVDAVILDCHLQTSAGEPLVPVLRAMNPDTPVIMLSGFCHLPCAQLRYSDICLQKGDSRALLNALRALRSSRRYGLFRAVA
jgi:ActR/RegA family two-component response regulator